MKKLPVQSETIDMETGEVITTSTVNFNILPPAAGNCQVCGVEHDTAQPRNAQSLYYQYAFFGEHGRWPTWVDAVAHCARPVTESWTTDLTRRGVDVAGGQIIPGGAA